MYIDKAQTVLFYFNQVFTESFLLRISHYIKGLRNYN